MLRGTGLSRDKSRAGCKSHSSWLRAPRCPCPPRLLHLTDRTQTSGGNTVHDEEGVQKKVRCQQGAASSPTWQLPVLEGVIHFRALGPGVALTTGHHVAGEREMMREEGTSATTAAMICVVMKPGAPRAGREVPPALASSLTEQPSAMFPLRRVLQSFKHRDGTMCRLYTGSCLIHRT